VVSLQSQTPVSDSGNAVTTVQAKVRVVLVDVVVTSGKGDSVTGLHKEDFEVLEDGKPQTIASFTEHQGAPPTQIKLPPMPPNVYTNYPLTQTADSVNVLLRRPEHAYTGPDLRALRDDQVSEDDPAWHARCHFHFGVTTAPCCRE
jgi:hypothetical protein